MTSFFKTHFPQAMLVLVLVLYFFFGLQHLGKFITADEHYWVYERIPQYWNALSQQKWSKTFINDKPGVSLALISGISYSIYPNAINHCTNNDDKSINCDYKNTESLYTAFRLPILIINGLLLTLFFFLVSRLTNLWVGIYATTFTFLSPILLGISQIVNPDSLLWSFGNIGIFSFLVFLKTKARRYIVITAVFTGLALLSKYSAIILFPFYFFLMIAFLLFAKDNDLNLSLKKMSSLFSAAFFIIIFGSAAILCLFLPALAINNKYINVFLATIPYKKTFFAIGGIPFILFLIDTFFLKNYLLLKARKYCNRYFFLFRAIPLFFLLLILTTISIRIFFPTLDIFIKIPFDLKNFENARYYGISVGFFESFLLEWNPLIFSLTPIVLIGTIIFLVSSFWKKEKDYIFFSITFPIISIAYTLIFLFSDILITPRYGILLYPIFSFLAALGFSSLSDYFLKYRFTNIIASFFIIAISIFSLANIRPFYFNYSNFLLPKKSLISDSWGYGGYEAAQYLNNLPNAKNLTVWSDYYGVCEFFVGKCLTAYTFDKETIRPDYYVLTRRGKIRYMSRFDRWEEKSGLIAYKYYDSPSPAWQLFIDNRPENFIKIVKTDYLSSNNTAWQ
jgi:4-amino-4-deoxy-L-arabinose transferase-like glycosyltransferase